MAYMSQEKKKELAPAIKAVLKKYGMKGSIAVRHHSTLVINISAGELDLLRGANDTYRQVNVYHVVDCTEDPTIKAFYRELLDITMGEGSGWFDKSDLMTDYFHTAWYVDINVGHWDKPYIYIKEEAA